MKNVEVPEDAFKKLVLLVHSSKPFLQIPPDNLALLNLWRVSKPLLEKLLKKSRYEIVTTKGKTIVKSYDEPSGTEGLPFGDSSDAPSDAPVEETKKFLCRKRKGK